MPKLSPSLLTSRRSSRAIQTQMGQIQTGQSGTLQTRRGRPLLLGLGAALGCCALNSCALSYSAASTTTQAPTATVPILTAPIAAPTATLNVRVLVAAAPQLTLRVSQAGTGAGQDAFAPAPLTPVPLAPPLAPSSLAQPPMTDWRVGVAAGQLTLNGRSAGNSTLYLPPTPGSVVEIAGKPYRGGVLLRVQDGGVQGVNVVNIEDYLRAVVPAEMPASWPAAALAAQAVIARTYVAAHINPAAPFDTCATESCQVYPGLRAEKAGTSAAVQATRSQVVAYAGKPASTYFSSDSGGFTASSAEVWGKALPYLRAQSDPYSAGGPRAGWRVEVAAAQLQAVAARYGARVGGVRAVTITRLSPSGRPEEITVSGAGGVARITGAKAGGFVRSLGAPGTRVKLSGINPLVITGSGAGHGVGLSQYGALGLAKTGQDHLRILGFYYPGTSLSALSSKRQPPTARFPGKFPGDFSGVQPLNAPSSAAVLTGGFRLPSFSPSSTALAAASGGPVQ